MRTLNKSISVGVYGVDWAYETSEMIRREGIVDYVGIFEYTDREALFIDQYDYFIVTDFGRNVARSSNTKQLIKLNQLREIIATRSMRTTLIVNFDDIDVATSMREACCRIIKVNKVFSKSLAKSFTEIVHNEVSKLRVLKNIEIEPAVA